MNESLKKWSIDHRLILQESDEDNIFTIEGEGTFFLLESKSGKIVDEEFTFKLSKEDKKFIDRTKPNNIVFEFGDKYYYTKVDIEKFAEKHKISVVLNDFKYLGKARQDLDINFTHLGIHTEYELMNGTHLAKDWVKKAKFLGQKSLGICDENTLAGTLSFQLACKEKEIKSIIGESIVIKYDNDEIFKCKLYVKNYDGWRNLLRINKEINVINMGFITKEKILEFGKGLVLVFYRESIITSTTILEGRKLIKRYKKHFDSVYYQIDTVRYLDESYDKQNLEAMSRYFNEYSDLIEPVLINDSFYIDREECITKKVLNEIDRKARPASSDQFYKTVDETIEIVDTLFNDEEKVFKNGFTYPDLLPLMIENTNLINEECNFMIDVGNSKIPRYEGDGKESNFDLFFRLIQEGLEKHFEGKDLDQEKYLSRIEEEVEVMLQGNLIDFFLIHWDMVKWAKENDIMVGTGRGSVVGSLVCMCLGITSVDPIEFNLLFERFLNKTRVIPEKFFVMELADGRKYKVPEVNDIVECKNFKNGKDLDEATLKKLEKFQLK